MCNYPLTSVASAGEPRAEVPLALACWRLGVVGWPRPLSAEAWTLPCPHPSPCSLQGAPVSTGQGRPQFLAHPAELEIAAWVAQRFLICSAGLTGLFTQAPEPQVAIKLGGPRKQTWLIRPMSPRSGVFSWSFLGFRYLGEGVEGGVFCMPILPLQISPRGNLKKNKIFIIPVEVRVLVA